MTGKWIIPPKPPDLGSDAGGPEQEDGGPPPGEDAGPGPDPPPECVTDEDCGFGRGCLAGICRNMCWLGIWCDGLPSGDICLDGLCVQCQQDADCRGGHMVCDLEHYICQPVPVDPDHVVIGAMYHQWWIPQRWQGDRGNYVYEPVLGHYDNSDPHVVRQHLDWAEIAGINTWVLDVWITDRDWGWVERNTTAVMDAADERGFGYFLLIDGWFEFEGPDDGYDTQAIAAKVNQRFAGWLQRPGYLRVDGKPVIFFWAAWGRPCSVFDRIRAGIEGTLGPIYLTGNNGETGCWDRQMMYNSYTNRFGGYDDQVERQANLWSDWEEEGFPWAPTAIPGYDDTHVREGNPRVPLDPEFFRRSVRTALSYNQHSDFPWLFVCSWSEWHEGSNIEPSSDFDDPLVFLRVMREELSAAGWVR